MPTITNIDIHKLTGFNAAYGKCSISLDAGETFELATFRVYPASDPTNKSDAPILSPDGDGNYVCGNNPFPAGTTGPYKAKWLCKYSKTAVGGEADVTGT